MARKAVEKDETPRGLRNNNPGNIRKTSTTWKGEIAGNDSEFETFETPVAGIRALCRILLNYQKKYGINTCMKVAMRWAPPCENNTNAYAEFLRKECNLPSVYTHFEIREYLHGLVTGITKIENKNMMPYDKDTISAGIEAALEG